MIAQIKFFVLFRQRIKTESYISATSSTRDHQFHRALPTSSGGEGLYGGLPPEGETSQSHLASQSASSGLFSSSLASKLGLPLMPNPAPDVDLSAPVEPAATPVTSRLNIDFAQPHAVGSDSHSNEPKRKKYAKEAWPGKKPTPSLLM